MESTNGEAQHHGSLSSVPEVGPVATAPAREAAQPLDASGIGKLVEQEVRGLLDAAETEADRIRSKALAGVRMAEAKVAALEQQVHSTLAQLVELAGRIEQAPQAWIQETAPAEVRADDHEADEPASPSVFDATRREPVAPNIPPSDEVIRLLREHLT
jgi:hypothetical protein